jgi:LPPG:FO 2-phospho-L-lactate transferase
VSGAPRVLAICGGVGGAKLALGLDRVLPPGDLAILVNTGDDFDHLGLRICPDLDTVMYTLGGVVETSQGWGREDDSRAFLDEIARLGGPTWFRLGDKDLAVHVERTRRLAAGETLAAVTSSFARSFALRSRLLPMSDDPVRTLVDTTDGVLEFQEYFVRRRCEPAVRAIRYHGADAARPLPAALDLLASTSLEAVVICPSNPWLSIDPILAMPELRRALQRCAAPVIAVSPLVAGRAIKGPTAKLMQELGLEVSAAAVAAHYVGLVDGFVLDDEDRALGQGLVQGLALPTMSAPTIMRSLGDRESLARTVLDFASRRPAGPRLRRVS